MPFRSGFRYFFTKFMNEVGEKKLAESYLFRRVAQLSIYQWTRLAEWATKKDLPAVRVAKNFLKNLEDEMKKIQGPKS